MKNLHHQIMDLYEIINRKTRKYYDLFQNEVKGSCQGFADARSCAKYDIAHIYTHTHIRMYTLLL